METIEGSPPLSGRKILKVSKRLDASNAAEFKGEAISMLSEDSSKGLIIDFSDTSFLDSAGLGALVSVLKAVSQGKEKRLALASLSVQVRQIFELTKLYRLFEIYNSVDDAVSEMGS